jgi:hypothetical protein
METVYIETTIVSYLVANQSRDLITAGQQQVTRDWWARRRNSFYCVVSQETLAEAARGDPTQAALRLAALAGLPVLPIAPEAERLATDFLHTGALPSTARSDAIHLAVATLVESDYLLTWNCRHLANAQIIRRLEREAAHSGWDLPTICTPPELMGDSTYGT